MVLLGADLDTGSIYRTMQAHGISPVRARHVIDALPADAVDARLLGVTPGEPLLRVRRTAWAADGSLVESADDRYLPSTAVFAIENAVDQHSAVVREESFRG